MANDAALPEDVRVVWDLEKAFREATPTRERVCLNGLWRWQPAHESMASVPTNSWGWFKVPGCWPGITDYLQKDCQTLHVHPAWSEVKLSEVKVAWYQRAIHIPKDWNGRRVRLAFEYLNSHAVVFMDGQPAGETRFPTGEVDITEYCRPGGQHLLSVLVTAMPLKAVLFSHADSTGTRMVEGKVARRGLCGDVYLIGEPAGSRIEEVRVRTSTREWTIEFDATLQGVDPDTTYLLRARVLDGDRVVREFNSPRFRTSDLQDHRITFAQRWRPAKLWDLNTPGNLYRVQLSLLDERGRLLDRAWPETFGFREFWIEGRDFYLNGSRIYLSTVPLDNAQVGAAWATYAAARESLRRLQSFGINFVYTHNYGCEPGTHLSFAEILRAADDAGMLVALSQPHFRQYDWQAPDAERENGYARHAMWYTRYAGNHPSVVCYSMSHNATGYHEDMNPDLIDGVAEPRSAGSAQQARLALQAEAIVRRLDPSRIVYHHSSGNLGAMHTSNFYPNFAPIQELSDWFEHWALHGVKPVFLCEYGAPFTWDWTMYRGWYQGKRAFGSAKVPWEFCLAEWNAQFLGDRAFQMGEAEKTNLRWENRQFRAGNLWHRWDYPHDVGSTIFEDRYAVFERYLTDNWRAFRTWGVSANSPWEHGHFWKLREGMQRNVLTPLAVDWENLQRPGFSPDYLRERYARMDLAYEPSDWVATPAAQALIRNNAPLLAYIGGAPGQFTSRDHIFRAGETLEKQIIVINNSRQTVTAECGWSLELPHAVSGHTRVKVPTGQQARVPFKIPLPADLPSGAYELRMTVQFQPGVVQHDAMTVHVLPPAPALPVMNRMALFDPLGETAELLDRLKIPYQKVDAHQDLTPYHLLVVGKGALTIDEPAPDLQCVRDGVKVIVFEQTAAVLEQRLGFRVAEYGLRQLFPRVPDHPVLKGLAGEHLCDWRGSATLLPPRLTYQNTPRYGPTVKWCGIDVPRIWRCGCRGNVASVLIEKPACGDFLPIVDGGFSLQYSPLMEYREGQGMVLFCQLDVTGRTEIEPAAEDLVRNIFRHVQTWKPAALRNVVYAGEPAGRKHLESAGFRFRAESLDSSTLGPDDLLVVGPGAGPDLAPLIKVLPDWLKSGGHLLALGLNEADADAFLPFKVQMKDAEHCAAFFESEGHCSPLAGVGPADVLHRGLPVLPLVTEGAIPVGNGVLARTDNGHVVFCQLLLWRLDYEKQYNLKRTFRRSAYLVTRLLANLGAPVSTPLLERFPRPVQSPAERRWLNGFYLDEPQEMDDPYRFFRW